MAQDYQNAPWGSHEHWLRLLEITAASVHALAGTIYASGHMDMDIKPPEPEGGSHRLFHRNDGFYVNCYHTNYRHFEEYPFGLLNVVGYWAETEIFGGVLLFEREEEGSGVRLPRGVVKEPMLTGTRSSMLSYTSKEQRTPSSYPRSSSSLSRT